MRGSLIAFASAAVAAGLGRAVVTTYLPVLMDQVRSAPGLIGTAMLVNAAAGFAVPLAVGMWSDRIGGKGHGRRLPFIFGGAIVTAIGLAAIALGQSSSILVLAALGAVAYVGLNAVTTAHRALVPDCFGLSERPRATSAQEVAMLIGGLLGIVAGGVATELAPWAPFVVAAVAVPILAVPTLVRVREPRVGKQSHNPQPVLSYYAKAAAQPGVRALLLAQILWVLGYAALPVFFVLYAERVLGLRPSVASLLLAGFGIATGIAMLAAGRVRDPRRYMPLLVLGVALMGGGFLGVAAAPTLLAVTPALAAGAVGFGLLSTIGFPFLTTLIPKGEEGGYTALYFSVRAISTTAALPAAGWAVALTGTFRSLFWAGGVITLTALIPLARVARSAGVAETRIGRVRKPRLARWRLRLPRPRLPEARWFVRWAASIVAVSAALSVLVLLLVTTGLQQVDESVFRAINSLGAGPKLVADVLDPHSRNYAVLVTFAVAVAAFTRPREIPVVLGMFALAALIANAELYGFQLMWDRPRPEEVLDPATIVLNSSWAALESFPSGHLIITTTLAGVTALTFPRLRWLMWSYVFAIGLSRMLFGAHFPLDVVGGIILGYVAARAAFALAVRTGLLARPRGAYERWLDREPLRAPEAPQPRPYRRRLRLAGLRLPAIPWFDPCDFGDFLCEDAVEAGDEASDGVAPTGGDRTSGS